WLWASQSESSVVLPDPTGAESSVRSPSVPRSRRLHKCGRCTSGERGRGGRILVGRRVSPNSRSAMPGRWMLAPFSSGTVGIAENSSSSAGISLLSPNTLAYCYSSVSPLTLVYVPGSLLCKGETPGGLSLL